MFYTCPKDPTHQSEDPDYCSICGAKIAGLPGGLTTLAPAPTVLPGAEACPDCGTPRAASARFCEVCRHDFGNGAAGVAAPAPVTLPPPVPPTPAPTPVANAVRAWEVVVAVDPSLYTEPDPQVPCPTNEPERTFPLDLPESLIGRRSERKAIFPEVPLTDTGVSHRHAKLLREADGGLTLLDVGSTNGTQINGADVTAGVRTPVQDGDQITLGCWTRLTVRARPEA